jgi:hypothetical protein
LQAGSGSGSDTLYIIEAPLTPLQEDLTNRGHRHLVLCSSSKAVESGKFCDNVHRLCAVSRLSRRRIDISTCACLFEFDLLENAQAMVNATIPAGLPSFTMRIEKPFYWLVKEVNTQHTGKSANLTIARCAKNT